MTIEHPPAKLIAAVLGLSSFMLAIVAGMIAGNPGVVVLPRAMLCMLVGYIVGRVLGRVAQVAAVEYIDAYREARPIPEPVRPVEITEDGEVSGA